MMKEDIQFLKELQQELNDQVNDGQASPRYWAIMDYKWVVTAQGHEDRVVLYDSDVCETMELDEYVDEILNGERKDEFSEDAIEELQELSDIEFPHEIYQWIEGYDDTSRYYPIYEEQVSFIAPNTCFFTKEEAKIHLEKNHYRYSSKAHTYAMTAWRAPKMERLIKILRTLEWDKVGAQYEDYER